MPPIIRRRRQGVDNYAPKAGFSEESTVPVVRGGAGSRGWGWNSGSRIEFASPEAWVRRCRNSSSSVKSIGRETIPSRRRLSAIYMSRFSSACRLDWLLDPPLKWWVVLVQQIQTPINNAYDVVRRAG